MILITFGFKVISWVRKILQKPYFLRGKNHNIHNAAIYPFRNHCSVFYFMFYYLAYKYLDKIKCIKSKSSIKYEIVCLKLAGEIMLKYSLRRVDWFIVYLKSNLHTILKPKISSYRTRTKLFLYVRERRRRKIRKPKSMFNFERIWSPFIPFESASTILWIFILI